MRRGLLAVVALAALLLGRLAHAGAEATRAPGWSAWRWTVADGLPLNHVTDVAFDPTGAAWVGTFDGLARFDGDTFTTFRPDSHPGLPSSRVLQVEITDAGVLWLLTESGDLVWRDASGFHTRPTESAGLGDAFALLAHGGALWVFGSDGIARADPGGLLPVLTLDAADRDRIRTLHPTPEGLLASTRHGAILSIDPTDQTVAEVGRLSRLGTEKCSMRWRSAAPGRLARTAEGLVAARRDTLWVQAPGQPARQVAVAGTDPRVHRGPDGRARIRTSAGLYALDGDRVVAISGPDGIPDTQWWTRGPRVYRGDTLVFQGTADTCLLAEDTAGGVWVHEQGEGLLHLRPGPVSSLVEDEQGPLGTVHAVMFDRGGALWIAAEDGLRLRDPDGQERRVRQDGRPVEGPLALFEDRAGTVWVDTRQGVCAVDARPPTGPVPCRPLSHPDERWPGFVHVQARDGRVWGGQGGIWVQDGDGRSRRLAQGEGWQPLRAMVELPDGRILAAANGGGLWLADGDALQNRAGAAGSPLRGVRALLVDDRGDAWLGTEGAGLCRLQLSAGETLLQSPLACIGADAGLADPFISSLVPDGQGRLWMSSNRGLHAVRWEDLRAAIDGHGPRLEMVSLGQRDGMVEPETNGVFKPSATVAPDGAIWYPTMHGVARLDPAAVAFGPPPSVSLETLATPARSWAAAPADLSLPEAERELRVAWTAVSFDRPHALAFRYRLAGLDTDWRGPTDLRTATWTSLPPGDYTVEVQAGWGDVWGPTQALATATVPPTFRETPAFWLLLATLAAGLSGLLVWGRLRQAQRRADELEAAVQAATRELADRNTLLVQQSEELSAQRRALGVRAGELAQRNARIAAQARELAERNERVAAQAERLEELDAVRTRFVANISHELRTPLTLIRGTLQDAVDRADGQLARPLGVAHRNAERLGELVEQLLDVARLDAGGVPLRARRADLGPWLRRVVGNFEGAAATRRVDLRVRADDGTAAWFDPDLMEKVVTNLVSNGLSYCPTGGWLEVALREETGGAVDELVMTVTDTGPGVPEGTEHRLFERFFQAEDSDRRARGGAGIGLALAREIVHLHGGEIDVRNTAGAGACFRVRLPAGAAHLSVDEVQLEVPDRGPPPATGAATADATPSPAPGAATGDAPALLLVEDHPDLRAWMAEHLSTVFDVVLAEDGVAALERLEAGLSPAVIVSDVMMPRLDGLGLCRRLAEDDRWKDIPVLLVTARASPGDRIQGLEIAHDYLAKPFRIAELLLRARRLAQRPVSAPSGDDAPAADPPSRTSAFIEKLEGVALTHLDDPDFGASALARRFGLSLRQLERRLHEEERRTPAVWLRELRLQRAQELLRGGEVETVGEAAAQVGMSRSYLSRLYRQWAGRAASEELGG